METEQFNTRVPKDLKHQLKVIAVRENRKIEEIVIEQLAEYVKVHGEGNPIYALEKWIEEPKFKAVPALFSKTDTWYEYLEKGTEKEREEIYFQLAGIKQMMEKRRLT